MASAHTTQTPFNRLLLTGAAGGLGKVLRETLRPYTNVLRLSDIAEMAPAVDDREEVQVCDLADKDAVHQLVEGVDAIVHFGGVSVERPFEEILGANICGVFHIYEAARRHGVKRVIFASSNHVIGFYKQTETIDAHPSPPGQLLRSVQVLRRRHGQLLLRSLRHRNREHPHWLVVCRTAKPPNDEHLAELC